ncbi:hypothetical protein AGMMS49982_23440 [Bacteroidia bacterium]|nr:hypothetical protein AGMMS49982_23440 [Bacteroidia bacterium]
MKANKLSAICSSRKILNYTYFDLVFEWEDVFQSALDIPIVYTRQYDRYINRIIRRVKWNPFSFFHPSGYYEFMWVMNASWSWTNSHYYRVNILPAIIDFYLSKEQLTDFYNAYSKIPFILISSLEAFNFLKENNCPKQIYHFPLSLPDKYKITPATRFEKEYDLVLMGRTNPVFDDYLKRYVAQHKDFTYVYRQEQGKNFHYFTSKGEFVGNINHNSRERYIDLMRKSKICLYSTPGMDGEVKWKNGFNQVTPRFLELLSCGCHVIARYKQNPDTDYYRLDKFSPCITSYDEFEKAMDKALNTEVDMKMYSEYLENHYTTKRVELLKTILEKENITWKK